MAQPNGLAEWTRRKDKAKGQGERLGRRRDGGWRGGAMLRTTLGLGGYGYRVGRAMRAQEDGSAAALPEGMEADGSRTALLATACS